MRFFFHKRESVIFVGKMNGSGDASMDAMEVHDGAAALTTNHTDEEGKNMTSKDYYFDSYAHFGIHEVSDSAGDIFKRMCFSVFCLFVCVGSIDG